jgi:hypothetical protein
MNVQELAYETAERVERFLQSTSPAVLNKTDDFVLAIICSQEKHTQSVLTSLYSKNKITPVILSSETLESYVNQKLFRKKSRAFQLTNYDPDHSSARVLISSSSGNGKSEYVKDLVQTLQTAGKSFNYKIIRMKSSSLNLDTEIEKLFAHRAESNNSLPTLFHVDVAYEVFYNLDHYLFSLFVLSHLQHSSGMVWQRSATRDMYLVEITPPLIFKANKMVAVHAMINYLPKIEFKTPRLYKYELENGFASNAQVPNLFTKLHKSELYQRSCFYIKLINNFREKRKRKEEQLLIDHQRLNNYGRANNQGRMVTYEKLDDIDDLLNQRFEEAVAEGKTLDEKECLTLILDNSGLSEPNWHEIKNYCSFLNVNLELIDKSELIKTVGGK